MNRILIGKLGEAHAENFLTAVNYRILKKNFHCRFGEIDIIAADQNLHPSQLVFFEIKTRTSDLFGTPEESISRQKLLKIFKTAIHFLNSSSKKLPRIWRIDALAVKLSKDYRFEEINHLKNIFNG